MSFSTGNGKASAHRPRTENDQYTSHDREYAKENNIQGGSSNTEGPKMSPVQHHRNDSADSIETIQRDFPPGFNSHIGRKSTINESAGRSAGRDQYSNYDTTSCGPDCHKNLCRNNHCGCEQKFPYKSSPSSNPDSKECCGSPKYQTPDALGLGVATATAAGHYQNPSGSNEHDRPRGCHRRKGSHSPSSSLSSESRNSDKNRNTELIASRATHSPIYPESRGRVRSSGRSSYDSSNPTGQSISDYIKKLAVVALTVATEAQPDAHHSFHYEDDYSRGPPRVEGSRQVPYQVVADEAVTAQTGKTRDSSPRSDLSSQIPDLPLDSDEERQLKKLRGKELLSGVLATATTIHAANVIYRNRKKRRERQKQLAEGEISVEEAKKERNRATLMNVAFMGIAAMGITSAVTEWKEVKEKKLEMREILDKKQKNHDKRPMKEQKLSEERRLDSHNGSKCYGGSEPNLNASYYDTSVDLS